ncbi:hypothetical protein BDD12DRAFT_809475 [Trichophaea hybrida]|nr:hypothetical protein BDD12DRAFT_809475 [Trichophaea hybrida]
MNGIHSRLSTGSQSPQGAPPQSPSPETTFLVPVNHVRQWPARCCNSLAAPPPIDSASGTKSNKDSKVPLHNNAAFNLAKDFFKSVPYTENPWPASQQDKLDISDWAWDEALDVMTVQQRAVGPLNGIQHVWERPSAPSVHIVNLTHGIQVATLRNNDCWIGKREDLPNSTKKAQWFAKSQPAVLIIAQFFPSNIYLGRQEHCNKFCDKRVTPQLICLAVTPLNCALRDYKKRTMSEPSQHFCRERFSHQALYERCRKHWNSIGSGCQAGIIEHMGSNIDARIASSAEHLTHYVAPNAAWEETQDLSAVFK